MQSQTYLNSLPLAEKLHRSSPDLTARIYSDAVQQFLQDGVIIIPGVIPLETLDQLDRDLEMLTNLSTAPEIYGSIGIDGPRKYYEAKHLRNLSIDDFRNEPPGLKLLDLQRYFESAKQLAFTSAITSFMEELFGSPSALIQSLTFWKSSEQTIHQDFSYVHHHRKLGELAAAWIPLEDIQAEAGPLIYYKGSHHPDQLGFYDWGNGSILASRDAEPTVHAGYTKHLENIVRDQQLEPSIFLPKRGDLLIWHGALIHGGTPMKNPNLTRRSFVCHYTSMASHSKAQNFRIADGYSFDEPPSLPYEPSLPRRMMGRVKRAISTLS